MNSNIGQRLACFAQIFALILYCMAQAGCAEVPQVEPKVNSAVAVKWLIDNYKTEYVLVTQNGRTQYLDAMKDAAVLDGFGDEKFVLVNGVPVLTVHQEFLSKYQVGGNGALDIVYVYKALTKEGLNAVKKKLSDMGNALGDGTIVIRESETVCHAVYCNGFLFNCSLHPQFYSNTPGACPLCNLPLRMKMAP